MFIREKDFISVGVKQLIFHSYLVLVSKFLIHFVAIKFHEINKFIRTIFSSPGQRHPTSVCKLFPLKVYYSRTAQQNVTKFGVKQEEESVLYK